MNNYFCTNSGRDCGCQPVCQPTCQEPPVQPGPAANCCPCSEDFRRALELLCSQQLRPLVDFSTFAFVTENYVLGAALTTPTVGTAPGDNLADPAGTYVCGGDNCESLTVSGELYPAQTGAAPLGITVTQAALCRLDAVAFEAAAGETETAAENFQTLSQTLGRLLRPERPQICTSLADALTGAAAVRASTVTAGPLIVNNSAILGQIGSILVMANSTDNRIYLICADRIGFLG